MKYGVGEHRVLLFIAGRGGGVEMDSEMVTFCRRWVSELQAEVEKLRSENASLREQVEDLRASADRRRTLYEGAIRRIAEREGEIERDG